MPTSSHKVSSRKRKLPQQHASEQAVTSIGFLQILDSMIEGFQVIDKNWRYVYLNDSVAKQSQKTKEELIGHTMQEMYPGIENTKMFEHLSKCMNERVCCSMENFFEFPNGTAGWFELRMEPVQEGVSILSLDITDRKMLDEAKSDFLSLASHQLRTPLTAMKWTIETLSHEGLLSPKQISYVQDLKSSVLQLVALVGDLLSAAKTEAGKRDLQMECHSLMDIINKSVALLRHRADARSQKIVCNLRSTDIYVYADAELFAESFENLLGNAIEYGSVNTTVSINVVVLADGFCEIQVHDFGIVISPMEHNKIFEKFFRGTDAKLRVPRSSGLGLYIAKYAAETNGGHIRFESEEGKGTTFAFTLKMRAN